MPNRPGFFSRVFSKSPAAAAAAPLPQNVPRNANTNTLSLALKKYVASLRTIRNQKPISRANLMNATKNNRANVNAALQNYIMNVNNAKYLNAAAQAALQTPTMPETETAEVVGAAATANNGAARAAQQVAEVVNEHKNALKNIKNENVNTNAKLNARVTILKNKYKNVNWSKVNGANLTNKQREILNALRNPFWAARQAEASPSPVQQSPRQAAPTRAEALMATAAQAQTQRAPRANLEKVVKAPNGRNIVVIRANNRARWNFKNNANKAKYNLANRNKNTPTVYEVNVSSGNLFKQGN